ncbi:cupin domain-containing protein [Synechococcus elongatus IITB4]|uniref:cupin domain-containing protein n=1 Tax=Synechococcus elongatus TaxID=32046 RepID=UPI0030D20B93
MAKQSVVVKSGEGTQLSVLGCEVRFLCEPGNTDHNFSLMEVVLPKDQGPPPHDHPWDEAYYVVEGQVRFLLGTEEAIFTSGDFIYAPGGTLHAFQGASDQLARVLVFDSPATAGDFFKDVDREVKIIPDDLRKIPEIGLRHQLRFQPSP